MSIERKLAAIMFTDIITGYTEQMSKDEVVGITLLSAMLTIYNFDT